MIMKYTTFMELSFYRMDASHLPFFLEVRNLVKDQLHDAREFSHSQALEWFSKTSPEYWIIKLEGVQVGYFRLLRHSLNSWQIGADIHPMYQHQGIGTRAYGAFIKNVILLETAPPKFLDLRVLKSNTIAYALYVKLGFIVVSEGPNDFEMRLSLKATD